MKLTWFMLFSLFLSLPLFQCVDPCQDVACVNGSCDEGICACAAGWEGTLCDVRLSDRFSGQWSGNFNCENQEKNTQIEITADPEDFRKISIEAIGLELEFNGLTFGLDETTLRGRINESYTAFAIDTQVFIIDIPNNPGVSAEVFGSGTRVNANTLTMQVKVQNTDFGAFFSCSGAVNR